MDVFLKWVEAESDLILSTIHVSSVLMSIFVLVILWIKWKTEIIRSTTLVLVILATYYTLQFNKMGTLMYKFAQPGGEERVYAWFMRNLKL